MVTRPWRGPLRAAAVMVGVVLPMFTIGMVHADLPGPPPLPPLPDLPNLPTTSTPIGMIFEPPIGVDYAPPAPGMCVIDISYDNTPVNPLGTIFRGQTACGNGINSPVVSGHAYLTDVLGNVVADAPGYGGASYGPDTSQGEFAAAGISTNGPVPGQLYTITYDTAVTIQPPQVWGPAPPLGCTVNGQTLQCHEQSKYDYVPGTQGGYSPD